ncbi:MAG: hypothetical protein ABSD73_03845 [Candidatus Bathyarchaeia archaeon]|jgi:sugar-specific transcriptional regulator TrmB
MDASYEEISRKYRLLKTEQASIDLFSLQREIQDYIKNRQGAKRKAGDMVEEAQDMLMDVTQMIEEGHCNPLRNKKL